MDNIVRLKPNIFSSWKDRLL